LIQTGTIFWNHDKGHTVAAPGENTQLRLKSADLNGINFFTNNPGVYAPSLTASPFQLYVPQGTSTITFTISQSYDRFDGTERILIFLATNGCQNFPIDAHN
jgi:hypothetical protein